MNFYVQQVDIDKASGRHDVILDVEDMDDHLRLASALGNVRQQDVLADGNRASMLRFSYAPSGRKGFKEGSWYDVDFLDFPNVRYQLKNPDAESASFLRGNLVGIPDGIHFSEFLTSPKMASIPTATADLVTNPRPGSDIELTVVNCGHGNWNEIRTASDRLIYDVGAGRQLTKADVKTLVSSREIAKETKPISVVISHWDVDHYHALLEFSPVELGNLRVVFTPSQVPDTETYKRVSKLLSAQGIPVQALQPAPRPTSSREITLEKFWHAGSFTLFRATPGRSRNQTGIVLGIRGKNDVALLTGDHHYGKVHAAVSKIANFHQRHCILVTPHHGGLAGTALATDWLAIFSKLTTPISCGANIHGHPIPEVEAELTKMQSGISPWRTDKNGTWTRWL